jgi:hypothetical protein
MTVRFAVAISAAAVSAALFATGAPAVAERAAVEVARLEGHCRLVQIDTLRVEPGRGA